MRQVDSVGELNTSLHLLLPTPLGDQSGGVGTKWHCLYLPQSIEMIKTAIFMFLAIMRNKLWMKMTLF
jgi:hypothetical protein